MLDKRRQSLVRKRHLWSVVGMTTDILGNLQQEPQVVQEA